MKSKTQIVVIHGGTTFQKQEEYLSYLKNRTVDLEQLRPHMDWKSTLQDVLGDGFDVLTPKMPNNTNAQYDEWMICFERILPLLNDEIVLVGHSLGGIFLAKYLSEHSPTKNIKALFLVAAPYDDVGSDESLASFKLSGSVSTIADTVAQIVLYFSEDDPVVPSSNGDAYKRDLPEAELVVLKDKGHFIQDTFDELAQRIKAL